MKIKELLLILLFFNLYSKAYNQNVDRRYSSDTTNRTNYILDGVFVKEVSFTTKKNFNNGFREVYRNSDFCNLDSFDRKFINNNTNLNLKHDSSLSINLTGDLLNKLPKKMQNKFNKIAVFFNPIEKYAFAQNNNRKNKESNFIENFFILDNGYVQKKSIEVLESSTLLPNSIKYYLKTKDLKSIKNSTCLALNNNFKIENKSNFLKPFYFSKYEVTNKEYREFVHYVRDSIAKRILAEEVDESMYMLFFDNKGNELVKPILKIESKINWEGEEEREALEIMKLPYYYGDSKIDSRKLNYSYTYVPYGYNERKNQFETLKKDTIIINRKSPINIYPDTLVWVNDFKYAYNEPMTSMYFWHPAYDDYPVVGLNYYQVQAFLHWKSSQLQQEFNKKEIELIVKVKLPNDFQWDVVSTAIKVNDTVKLFPTDYNTYSDDSWLTDLRLRELNFTKLDSISLNETKNYTTYRDFIFESKNKGNTFDRNFSADGTIHTQKSNLALISKKLKTNQLLKFQQDEFGICFMGGNVSEWIENDYFQWKSIFELRQKQLMESDFELSRIQANVEKYYDNFNHPNGKLIRGGNWYDERFSSLNGKNVSGNIAKTFISPDSSYSTVGFRYIIEFEEK